MYNILKVVVLSLLPVCFMAQSGNPLNDFADKKYRLNKNGMVVLTTWASVNIVEGSVGYFVSKSQQEKYFSASNAALGLINLGIALPSLLAKKKDYNSKIILMRDQTKTEKIFLANAILDLTYITGGFLLKEVSKNQTNTNTRDLCAGFGDSFIVQGAGLLVFDTFMTYLNVKMRKKHLDPLLDNISISFNSHGFGVKYQF